MSTQMSVVHELFHEQEEPSSIWVIQHKTKNMTPIAECFDKDDSTKRLYPTEVKAIDQATVAISFSHPYCGKAYII